MEQTLRPIYQERASFSDTLGVLQVSKRWEGDPLTDTFDEILLIISSSNTIPIQTKHYTDGDEKAAVHVISENQLKKWLLLGTKRKVVDWLFYGKVFFDRNEYIENLKKQLLEYPFYGRDLKMGIELAKLVRRYMEGKTFYEQQHHMDAYHHAVQSLHHLARLAVIEKGILPEVTVWSQVKKIDPSIYKLYEELIMSDEPIEKRLELMFLASEFFIHNRTEYGARHILGVMSQKETWTIQELHQHEELKMYSVDLEMLIEFLIEKNIIKVMSVDSKSEFLNHRIYSVLD
ncbi:nucleotidyltransferase-like protein [Sporosarcina sp. A2]|uniref:nucleotidyltransferase-like protein n=1 Tax=Sporosarcina sp. A2 TaxID=3393449 RepID=UPI003D7B07EE